MGTMCVLSKILCDTLRLQRGILVFETGATSVAIVFSGAWFEEHCCSISKDILNSVFNDLF